jgi:hypothetical protein
VFVPSLHRLSNRKLRLISDLDVKGRVRFPRHESRSCGTEQQEQAKIRANIFHQMVVTYFSDVGSRRCRYHEDRLTPSVEAATVNHIKIKSQQTSCNTMPPCWIVTKRDFLLHNSPRSLIVPDDEAASRDYGMSGGPVAN